MSQTYGAYGTFESVNGMQAFVDGLNDQERAVINTYLKFGSYKLMAALFRGNTNPLVVGYKGDSADQDKKDALAFVQSIADPKTPDMRVKQIQAWVEGDMGLEFMVSALVEARDKAKTALAKKAATKRTNGKPAADTATTAAPAAGK